MLPSPPRVRHRAQFFSAALVLVVAFALAAGTAIAPASPAGEAASAKALDYVASCQRSDGGFAEKSASGSSDSLTAWTIVAIASAGHDPDKWRVDGHSPVAYLAKQSGKWRTVNDFARTALAACAARKSPRDFGGANLVAKIRAEKTDHGAAGDSFGPNVNSHIWALIALKASGEEVTAREVSWLLSEQNTDGGWGSTPEGASNTNDTAAALQALVACGQAASSDGVKRGIDYLRGRQSSDGGFNSSGGASDANSTSWAMQALVAAGQDPDGSSWKKGSKTPMGALVLLKQSSGIVRYTSSRTSNPLLTTVQAVPAYSLKAFPLAVKAATIPAFQSDPQVQLMTPAPEATIAPAGPLTLQLLVTDGTGVGIDPATLKVTVDGKKVSAKLINLIAQVGPLALKTGKHTVVATVADRAGNSVKTPALRFTVAPPAALPAASPLSMLSTSSAMATGSATATSHAGSRESSETTSSKRSAVASASTTPFTARRPSSDRNRWAWVTLGVLGAAIALTAAAITFLSIREALKLRGR